jgi:hypothetical protein
MRVLALAVLAACKGFFDPRPPDGPAPPPDSSLATIEFVQANTVYGSGQTYVELAFPTAQRQGDLAIAVIEWSPGPAITTVSDHAGNNWKTLFAPYGPSSFEQAMFYAENIAAQSAGQNVLTVSFSGTVSAELRLVEYAGIAMAGSLDATQANTAAGMTADSGALTTTHAHDLLVASDTTDTSTMAAGPGYTSRLLTSLGNIIEDREVTDVASYNAAAPLNGTGYWVMELAAFKAAD